NKAPEIENLCLINENGVFYEYNKEKRYTRALCTNSALLNIFSVKILSGERKKLLENKEDLLVTESFAKKVFGNEDPVGKVLEFGNDEKKIVKAVIADPGKLSSLKYDIIFNPEQQLFKSIRGYNEENYVMFSSVLLLNSQADPELTAQKIADILKPFEGYKETGLLMQPFKEVYFDLSANNDSFSHANLNMIRLLTWISLIILLLAIVNYINLSTSLNNERYKEICIRKTSGARKSTIIIQFLQESYLSCLIAIILAVFISVLISGYFTEVFGREINILEALKSPRIILAVIVIFICTGGLTGIIPALIVAKYNPVDLMRRKIKLNNSNVRDIFSTIQLITTLVLIISLGVITKQIKFIKAMDPGFEKSYLLAVRLEGKTTDKSNIIKDELLKSPDIIDISGTHGIPFAIYGSSSGSWKEDSVEYKVEDLSWIDTDTSFVSAFGLQLLAGRNFRRTDQNVVIINESLYEYLNYNGFEGRKIFGKQIIGIVKDFHFKDMHKKIGFLGLSYASNGYSHLNFRIRNYDIPTTLGKIKDALHEFEPMMTFDPVFYDNWVNTFYHKEEQQAKAVKIFALIALLLSCMGILGLAKFTAIRRTKEIGIRKVNGAKIKEVMIMLNKDFVKWVVIAVVIACPVAWYAMDRWLQNFAYKTDMSWWIFALAGMLAMAIALLTVSWQSWRAAGRNPVEALRYE
ncbi:MAG TPA: FtsX-like permease family protein, partial [Bacteroidales bacterium]|nr:FtsX-like permease family protein [Bacteroidales bacterium]